jgi:hypothetical protein
MALAVSTVDQFVHWTVPDPVPDAVYASIAQQVAAEGFPAQDNSAALIEAELRSRHVLYWEKTPPLVVNGKFVNYGDCGAPNAANVPTGGLTAVSDVSAGIGAGVGVAAGAVTALGGSAAATAAGLGLLNAVPIVGTVAALALLPFEVIFAHHAAAVAKEQSSNCAAWVEFNQWLDAVDNAVETGQVLPADGVTMCQQLYQQASSAVSGVSAACTPGNTNAACDLKAIANGCVLLRQWMYSNLPQFNPASSSALATASPSGAASASPLAAIFSAGSGSGSGLSPVLILLLILAALAVL